MLGLRSVWGWVVAGSCWALMVLGKNEEHAGSRVYNVKLTSQEQQERLAELQDDLIDYWRRPSLDHGVVGRAMVLPQVFTWFEQQLAELGIDVDVFIEDVKEHLDEVEKSLVKTSSNDSERMFDFDGYYRYDEILAHLRALQEEYENTTVTIDLVEYGLTENNRPIVYLKISNNVPSEVAKPVVVVEAGVNPREWITIPAALNVVNKLVEGQSTFLDRSDWIVIPAMNPDGYEYTHTNLRLWTKNFSTRSNFGFICPGANLNRNFDIAWQISGSSSSPCSYLFAGVQPFSETETQMVRSILEEHGPRVRLYVSLQNSGGFVSYPWQYERAASGMFRQHHLLGLEMVAAMSEEYKLVVGWSGLGGPASGTSTDYAQDSGILYSYNIDVVQRGNDGVSIPEDEIRDVVEGVWRGIAVAADNLLN